MKNSENSLFCSPTGSNLVRGNDPFGQGRFGASRGLRLHVGVDFSVTAGEPVYAPVFGKVVRTALPYKSDQRYKGLVIEGLGKYVGYVIKLFYLEPRLGIVGRMVTQGEVVGTAQDLTIKYRGITNHIHFEITQNGVAVDPTRFLATEESCKA
jgi:murein DD-endopeptidase MepM/ murein hydrolase activator NlpD